MGSSTYSTYMDRFGRPILDHWERQVGGGGAPALFSQSLGYDDAGNVQTITDNVLCDTTPRRNYDVVNTFDSLRRLARRDEGKQTASAVTGTDRSRTEIFARNLAGRVTSDKVNLDWASGNTDANGEFDDGPLSWQEAGEMRDARTYNKRNELLTRSVYDVNHTGSPDAVTLSYDLNGNLTDDGETYKFVYNPWGQLVQILDQSDDPVAVYTYNGLGHRISEQTDTSASGATGVADGQVDGHDPVFFIAVDIQGRRVATYRNTDTYPKETFVYHPDETGYVRGPSFAGGVLLRDRNASLTDVTKWASEAAGSTRTKRNYYLSDTSGNVVALVEDGGALVEQYRYTSTGLPYGIPLGDVDGDGTVDYGGTDGTIAAYIRVHAYEDRIDLDMNGSIEDADVAIVAGNDGHVTGRGALSTVETANHKVSACFELYGNGTGIILLSKRGAYEASVEESLQSSLQRMVNTPANKRAIGTFAFRDSLNLRCVGLGDDWNPPTIPSIITPDTSQECLEYCNAGEGGWDPWGGNLCVGGSVQPCVCAPKFIDLPPGYRDAFYKCVAAHEIAIRPIHSCQNCLPAPDHAACPNDNIFPSDRACTKRDELLRTGDCVYAIDCMAETDQHLQRECIRRRDKVIETVACRLRYYDLRCQGRTPNPANEGDYVDQCLNITPTPGNQP